MAGRRTNLALLVALAVAMGTGVGAFAIGVATGRPIVVAHGVAGAAVVLLAPWKQQIVRRGLRRRRRARWAGLTLLALLGVAIGAGVVHAAGSAVPGGVSAMQVHVAAAVAAVVPVVVHLWTRPVRPRAADVGRRSALRAGGLAVAAGALWRVADSAYVLGGASPRRFTGSHERGSGDPARMPVTQWLSDTAPVGVPEGPTVAVDDRGDLRHLSLAALRTLPQVERRAVLDCTGGWYAAQTWAGVALSDLVRVGAGRRVLVVSRTGYARAFPVDAVGALLLALAVGGAPLSVGHGAPVRLVAPGRRGFWWVKWVDRIVVDDVPPWVHPPFPLQ